ncbi:MAG TPA: 50S ribosomal protein L15 [Actinomycetota bacterium]|nr:50S ribosomal protein L15 [Actinomycetota bacterium]
MKVHHLRPAPGSKRPRKRVGRGIAAGQGKTAGRGTKGYLARHGSKPGFEGGQMPLARRVPKWRGFTNPNREEWAVVNVERLQAFDAGATVTVEDLRSRGMVPKKLPVKVLGRGDLDRKLTVRVHAFSASARAKIEGAGGSAEVL